MEELTFKVQSGIGRNMYPEKNKPLNNALLTAYKEQITKQLQKYISGINKCGGYILITVEQDGETFTNQLLEMKDHALFAKIIDEWGSK